MDVFGFGEGEGAKAVFQHPLAPVAQEVVIAGVFPQHVGAVAALHGVAQADEFVLGEGAGDFEEHVAAGLQGGADVFDLEPGVAGDDQGVGFEFQEFVELVE